VTRKRWILAAAAVGAALVVTAAPTGRLKYLALPLVSDPSAAPQLATRTIEDTPAPATVTARVPGRVSAILPVDDAVFVGTFDQGLYRCVAGACEPVGALEGRERFVDALVEWDRFVVAATHRGGVVLSRGGTRTGVLAAGQAVSSLAVVDGNLLLGTAHGLWSARTDAAVGEQSADGETLRVTALALNGDVLWIGTPDGVYAVDTSSHTKVGAWHALVFGQPAASTNVVTALTAFGDGVLVGTDDGGVVFVDDQVTHAAPFAERAANGVSPGAIARIGDVAVVGTEGGGLLAIHGKLNERSFNSAAHRVAFGNVSAVTAANGTLWFGREDGRVYALAASKIFWMSAS
jgi:outer membrane protein assembly factor BamB